MFRILLVMSMDAPWQASLEPEIVTILFSVPGTYSPRCETLIRAPDTACSSSMVVPPRPKMQPMTEFGTAICITVWLPCVGSPGGDPELPA